MRTTVLLLGILSLLAPSTAYAVDCDQGQGIETILDWKKSHDAKPLLVLGLKTVKETCVEGASTYAILGMPGAYPSQEKALNAFKYLQALNRLGFTPEQLTAGAKYVTEIEAAAGETGTSFTLLERDDLARPGSGVFGK